MKYFYIISYEYTSYEIVMNSDSDSALFTYNFNFYNVMTGYPRRGY